MSGRRPSSQEAVLTAMSGECHRLPGLAADTGLGYRAVSLACGDLVSRGLVERTEVGCYRRTAAGREIIKAGGRIPWRRRPAASNLPRIRSDSMRSRLWRAIRMMGQRPFTGLDVMGLAAKAEDRNPRSSTTDYLAALRRAGFLEEMPGGRVRRGDGWVKQYRLVRDTGRLAPMLRADGVFDPNSRELAPWQA
ncbi:MAG: hypothetical protein GC150_17240 [Rhizobiales bacterium]|nr:hypothetical protein [Hyphomicrobiales bacterium]